MPAPNMSSTFGRFAHGGLTRRRYGASTTSTAVGSSGLRVRASYTDSAFRGLWEDAPAEQSKLDPTGQNAGRFGRVYTRTDLRVAAGDDPADVVIWRGDLYEVTEVARWYGDDGSPTGYVATVSQITRTA